MAVARIIWLVILALTLGFFFISLPSMARTAQTEEGFGVESGAHGEQIVTWVDPNGPAERAGMNEGDELLAVNGLSVTVNSAIAQQTEAMRQLLLRSPTGIQRLIALAFSTSWADTLFLILNFLQVAGFSLVGILIFLRRSNDWMATLVALSLVTWGVSPMIYSTVWASRLDEFLYYGVAMTGIFLVFGLFPNGRFVPRWAPLVCLAGSAWYLARLLPVEPTFWDGTLAMLINSALLLAGLGLQIYRYRRVSDRAQQQQTKWVVAALAIPLIYSVGVFSWLEATGLRQYLLKTAPQTWVVLVILQHLSLLVTPVMVGWSVLRYRLWDIDVVINRALVYSGLTALLALVGLLALPLATALVRWLTSDTSPFLAMFITALPIAALFKPALERMQHWVDRYFKPEEISFHGSFIEFSPGVHELLSVSELAAILADQLESQLHLDQAIIMLKNAAGKLEAVMLDDQKPTIMLDLASPGLARLQHGGLVENPPGLPFSMLVPLTVKRARHPDFIGTVALGQRRDGVGYSKLVKKGLAEVGQEAGAAIYVAQLRDRVAQSTRRRRSPASKRSVQAATPTLDAGQDSQPKS